MARYIDADALIEMCKRQIECEWNTIAAPGSWADAFQDFSDLVEQTPTADVVPRAELAVTSFQQSAKIATLTAKLESREAVIETLRDISEHLAKMLDKMIVKTRSDVAREIIDDLASEGLLNVEPWGIANLKKKYTEG